MNKFYLFSIVLSCCLCANMFSSQPAERGLIFTHTHTREQNQPACGSDIVQIQKPIIRKLANPTKEVRADQSSSNVFQVEGLEQFLKLATSEKKPLIIKIVSSENSGVVRFQKLADQMKDTAVFVSMDPSKNHTSVKLLLLILQAEGQDLTNRQLKLPFFILSHPGFVLLKEGVVNFQKSYLKFLTEGDTENNDLRKSVLKVLGEQNDLNNDVVSDPVASDESVATDQKESKVWILWKKAKMWLRSKFQ